MAIAKASRNDWQEIRRFQALELKLKGWKQNEIAEALGVTPGAVSQWLTTIEQQGVDALRSRPRSGAPARLTEPQRRLLPDFLSHGAEAYGFRGDVWTCARVAHVIKAEFGVVYHKDHVSRLLKALEWTPQKPVQRATPRDEKLIETWRTENWETLQQKAQDEHRALVFVDESGFYLLPGVVKTYAPKGSTPILHPFETRDHLSAMSGITMDGELFTMVRDDSLTGSESVTFLKHLLRYAGDRLLVIWDGSPIHRNAEVKAFLSAGAAHQIHLEPLPPYAPDLNPDEGVWNHLKNVELRNLCCSDLAQLHHELDLAILRLRRQPERIQAFFAGAGLEF